MATALPPRPQDVVPIEEEMRRSYLDYAMSVIVSRALPDVRDGLKPVQRRILYAMREGGYDIGRPYRKSARIVGDVMGKYHPHGDGAIYDAMVRLAQNFTMRLPLVDGQGNFGSMDGDPPAAMRYTEARLGAAAATLLDDYDKDTVDFRPNYDESEKEPVVLPAQFPHLLVNGAGGIAVGMATNIPPHNLGELIDACIALIDDPEITAIDLMEIIKGPDFPTGGIILGQEGIRQAYATGRGSIMVRGRAHREEVRKEREAIVITEVPYLVNKARMIERIADVVREKRVEGIADLRDESDRQGTRVVIELRRDADYDVVLNQIYKFTPLQTTFGINMVALSGGRPQIMTLREILEAFLDFRQEVILRRTAFDLAKARDRAHLLLGLAIAVANIDEIIALIRRSSDTAEAREGLMARDWPIQDVGPLLALTEEAQSEAAEALAEEGAEAPSPSTGRSTYRLSQRQAQAILDLRLQRLTALERQKIQDELHEIGERIKAFLLILRSHDRLLEVMKEELAEVRAKFANDRRTSIEEGDLFDIDIEDLIQKEDMVVTVTNGGYIKRVPLSTYRSQRRGGKGRAGMTTHDDDFVATLFVANTHTPVLFFSSLGRVYKLKVYKLPVGTPQARGKAMVNMFPHLAEGETISTIMPLPEDEGRWAELNVMFATARGKVRRNDLSDFTFVPTGGKIAMRLDEGERLVHVQVCDDSHDVLLALRGGKCIRFPVKAVRVFRSRTSEGVRGVTLAEGDEVISMSILDHVDAEGDEREAFIRAFNASRRAGEVEGESRPADLNGSLDSERYLAMLAKHQLILTVTANGFGKRTSAYEYRTTDRGGQGIINILTSERNGPVTASFPVGDGDQLMLVTDAGKLIRIPVDDIRIAGRNTQGVVLFKVDPDEHIVSVAHLPEAMGGVTDDVLD
ncbi:DNA gyrase subunit A [Marinivivus vitaminiproducens]|uniref:DNA gyrase subunit A n=1 Tax=Marinivivus vitaminiproducens TaxID=3035935 RepID=UPI002799DC22|nr:DNA gyrase subunit A [Geminicoccaceae bacterium SCSIO 64248]